MADGWAARVTDADAVLDEDALVVVTRGALDQADWRLLTEARSRGLRALVAPLRGVAAQDRGRLKALQPVLVWLSGSEPPASWRELGAVAQAPSCGFRPAEDAFVAGWLGLEGERRQAGGIIVAGKGAAATGALEAVAKSLAAAPSERSGGLISLLLTDFSTAASDWALPSLWVRSALAQAAPFGAASHESIADLAAFGVMDSPRRAAALYAQAPERMLVAAEQGRRAIFEQSNATEQTRLWSTLLSGSWMRPRRPRTRPRLSVLLDLAQDFDVLIPTLERLRDRDRIELHLIVTDWLCEESPRTLQGLEAAGFVPEILSRGDVRKGLAPMLDGVAGVLAATETSVGPHRAGHSLAKRAGAAGLPSFTVQHGLANIGLTYRDAAHDANISFASDTIFIWGQVDALPSWVSQETRTKVETVGDMRASIASEPASALPRGDWEALVGVFENLHWGRYDDDYRSRFLADLALAAEANPRSLFLIKPHHAARWSEKNRERLPLRGNIRLIETQDPVWQTFTAPALIAGLDRVITTPSTVAVDAARAGAPVALAGYDLVDMESFQPLPMLRSAGDWIDFCRGAGASPALLADIFLNRAMSPGSAPDRMADRIEDRLLRAAEA